MLYIVMLAFNMKHKRRIILILLAVALVVFILLGSGGNHRLKRSLPGRVVRYILGSAGAHQWVEDFVDDIRDAKELVSLQSWANDVMERYRQGSLKTIGEPSYWAYGTHRLDPNEVAPGIREFWNKPAFGNLPEVTIQVSESGECKYVAYCWYLKGVVIAGSNYPSLDFSYFHAIEAKPGIFAYSIEK
jgi:hypothetical protein